MTVGSGAVMSGARDCAESELAGSGGLILLYHRVARVGCDPQLLCVTPAHFSEHMEVLRRLQRPVRLADLAERYSGGSCLGNVAVTFDDGYADNLHNAKPILDRFDVYATVFVVAHEHGARRELWWDELARITLGPGTLADPLCLTFAGREHVWQLGDAAACTRTDFGDDIGWNVLSDSPANVRQSLYRSLFDLLQPLSFVERRVALDDLCRQANNQSQTSDETLSSEEIRVLADGGLVEIGAHTMTHSRLSALPICEQRAEIEGSRRLLAEILTEPVRSFSYPFGTKRDYTDKTIEIVREAGFDMACSNFSGVVSSSRDRFQLPRMIVRDWDGDTFAKRIGAELARV